MTDKTEQERLRSLAKDARAWVASPEGQAAIAKALEEAKQVTEALKPKPSDRFYI